MEQVIENREMSVRPEVNQLNRSNAYAQKYSLQRRNEQGHFVKVDSLNGEITQDEVLAKFGPGYYILKSTKPRFRTIWKQHLGNETTRSIEALRNDMKKLDKRTKYTALGFGAVAITEAVGFGLTHWRFLSIEERLDQHQAILQTLKPQGVYCGTCRKPVELLLQQFCGYCGARIGWPRNALPKQYAESTEKCFYCNLPLQNHHLYCPHCGRPRPIRVPNYQLVKAGEVQR